MSSAEIKAAARAYCEAYDAHQTLYARLRMEGADPGQIQASPPEELVATYQDMQAKFDALYRVAMGSPRPNYVVRTSDA